MKYFLYTRKSTEAEERQALSLQSQRDKARELFPDLEIIELPPEAASAFKPDNRPIFADMLRRIDAGEAHGIIAWHPDRLSRNEIDASGVTYRVRTGAIRDLKFGSYAFDNSPEGMMMLQLTMSQSQYFSAKLSKDVKRGNEKKLSMGWKPGWAPTGYLNTPERMKGTKIIINDPDRWSLIQRAWRLMLTGNCSVPDVLDVLNNDWGYRLRRTRKTGDCPVSRSTLYRAFTDPFYAGYVRHNGELYKGSHEPMITLEEFDRVQVLLGRKGRPRPKTHDFLYRGPFQCGECGCAITAETKTKAIKRTGLSREYTYYHCTHKKPCSQRSLTQAQITEQIDNILASLTIEPEFRDWALDVLRASHDQETEQREVVQQTQSSAVLKKQHELDVLTGLRLRELIDDKEYVEQRERLAGELERLKEALHDTERRADKWLELTERVFDFATNARYIFNNGTDTERRDVFTALGGSLTLRDQRVHIELYPWFVPIKEKYPAIARSLRKVRTNQNASSKEKTDALTSASSQWLRGRDSNPRPID